MKLLTYFPCEFEDCSKEFGAFSPAVETLREEGAECHLVSVDPAQCPIARCSLWWSKTPVFAPHARTGAVGHFHCEEFSAGAALLRSACEHLRSKGCSMVLGPLNGSIWNNYRFITDFGKEPRFLFEPEHPAEWPVLYESEGFVPHATFTSTLVTSLPLRDEKTCRARASMEASGVNFRQIDLANLKSDLESIYDLSHIAFGSGPYYTPYPKERFVEKYVRLAGSTQREFVIIAERAGILVGFLFGIPDHIGNPQRTPAKALIAKTLAILPGREFAGLGRVLMAELHESALRAGYDRVIHAFQKDGSSASSFSRSLGSPMRRYALYARQL